MQVQGVDMLMTLRSVGVDVTDELFQKICLKPVLHDRGFMLAGRLRVSFDPSKGGRVRLAGVLPALGEAHWRLTPVNLGGADWYSIECDLPVGEMSGLDQIIPCLDVTCPRSTAMFALLRVFGRDGRSVDSSSTMVEVRHERRRHAFPICLSDLPAGILQGAQRATMIFFIEARAVDLHVYGMSVTGVRAATPVLSDDAHEALRATLPATEGQMRRLVLDAGAVAWAAGLLEGMTELCPGIFLDLETGPGRAVALDVAAGSLTVDFNGLETAQWRSLEFRFADFVDTGAVQVAVRMMASTAGGDPVQAGMVLRQYKDEGAGFADSALAPPLMFYPSGPAQEQVYDLSARLPEDRASHAVGIMLFLPPSVMRLHVRRIEVTLFDALGAACAARPV